MAELGGLDSPAIVLPGDAHDGNLLPAACRRGLAIAPGQIASLV
jgi:hypothetical protein